MLFCIRGPAPISVVATMVYLPENLGFQRPESFSPKPANNGSDLPRENLPARMLYSSSITTDVAGLVCTVPVFFSVTYIRTDLLSFEAESISSL